MPNIFRQSFFDWFTEQKSQGKANVLFGLETNTWYHSVLCFSFLCIFCLKDTRSFSTYRVGHLKPDKENRKFQRIGVFNPKSSVTNRFKSTIFLHSYFSIIPLSDFQTKRLKHFYFIYPFLGLGVPKKRIFINLFLVKFMSSSQLIAKNALLILLASKFILWVGFTDRKKRNPMIRVIDTTPRGADGTKSWPKFLLELRQPLGAFKCEKQK